MPKNIIYILNAGSCLQDIRISLLMLSLLNIHYISVCFFIFYGSTTLSNIVMIFYVYLPIF